MFKVKIEGFYLPRPTHISLRLSTTFVSLTDRYLAQQQMLLCLRVKYSSSIVHSNLKMTAFKYDSGKPIQDEECCFQGKSTTKYLTQPCRQDPIFTTIFTFHFHLILLCPLWQKTDPFDNLLGLILQGANTFWGNLSDQIFAPLHNPGVMFERGRGERLSLLASTWPRAAEAPARSQASSVGRLPPPRKCNPDAK